MKITDVKAVYPQYRHVPPSWRTNLWQIVVRVESDAGVVGYGYGGGGRAAVEVVNGHMRELLIGRTVDDTSDIFSAWDDLYFQSIPYGRKGIGVMALSGIDLALWDAWGRPRVGPSTRSSARAPRGGLAPTRPAPTLSGTPSSASRRTSSLTARWADRRTTRARSRPPPALVRSWAKTHG